MSPLGGIYETEDNTPAGFYRYVPDDPQNLAAGGSLQMLAVRDRRNYDTRTGQRARGTARRPLGRHRRAGPYVPRLPQ